MDTKFLKKYKTEPNELKKLNLETRFSILGLITPTENSNSNQIKSI